MSETCLQLDVGNTRIKWRLIAASQVIARGHCRIDDSPSMAEILSVDAPQRILVASVASAEQNEELEALFYSRWSIPSWFARSVESTGKLVNSYADPERLGVDRWAAMLGAIHRKEGRIAVIDAGSALTIDIVAASGLHEGGYIIPGAALMERSLLLDTQRVRFAEDVGYGLEPGCSTAEAVRHGIAAAQAGAVDIVLRHCEISFEQTVFCGGGSSALIRLLKIDSESVPDLVFEGLEILAALTPRSPGCTSDSHSGVPPRSEKI